MKLRLKFFAGISFIGKTSRRLRLFVNFKAPQKFHFVVELLVALPLPRDTGMGGGETENPQQPSDFSRFASELVDKRSSKSVLL